MLDTRLRRAAPALLVPLTRPTQSMPQAQPVTDLRRAPHLQSQRFTVERLEDRHLLSEVGSIPSAEAARAQDSPPNIVLIVSDDQRYDTFRVMTETRRELARNGTRFRNAYVTTAQCCPSRSSILTGQYAHNHGVRSNALPIGGFARFDDSETLATWLHDAGYRTGLYGKYLNQYEPEDIDGYVPPGWDEFHAFNSRFRGRYVTYALSENGITNHYGPEPDEYSTDLLATMSRWFIGSAEENDAQPFFLYFAPFAPHRPALPAPRHAGTLGDLDPYRPSSFNESDVGDKPAWLQGTPPLSDEQIASLDRGRERHLESLLALDEAIGSIVKTLRETHELDNTVIIFLSDNGLQWGEHRQMAKATPYEESIHVPMLIRDGRNPIKRVVDEFALNIDVAPTILEYARVTPTQLPDGRSLAPLIAGTSVEWRTGFLVEHWKPGQEHSAVRTRAWLYVEYANGDRELYDMERDPFQNDSRHADPAFAAVQRRLSRRIESLRTCAGDLCA